MLGEAIINPAPPERFRELVGDRYAEVERAVELAQRTLKGKVIWHLNSTAKGGGVAEMLQSLLAYARGAGVDVRWLTVAGDEAFFKVTKRLHNNLHGAPGDGGDLGDVQRRVYEGILAENAAEFASLVRPGDIAYLHDPQTAGMIGAVREAGARVVWRCHVGTDGDHGLARRAWDFLRPYVDQADAYVFSRREFIWSGLDPEKVWVVPPSVDAFSPKNQEIPPEAVTSILNTAGILVDGGEVPTFTREDGTRGRVDRAAETDQDALIPADAPVVAQVSRWDTLKDPVGVLECFAEHVRNADAHLLLAGPSVAGVTDDPEGAEVLARVRSAREGLPADLKARVHLASLPMEDVGENAAIVNAIQRRADVVLQKSLAEGFGLTVAEAMWKATPVVASRVGGIQDQIEHERSGILVDDPRDLAAFGSAIDGLLADPVRAAAIGSAGRERVRERFLGARHLVQYMDLIKRMLSADET